jgi:hypothetical protein
MASVRCYLSYIKTGKRGAEQLDITVKNGIAVKA